MRAHPQTSERASPLLLVVRVRGADDALLLLRQGRQVAQVHLVDRLVQLLQDAARVAVSDP